MVHTTETVRLRYFMDLLMGNGRPVMLVGGAGCGKTVLVNDKLLSLRDTTLVTTIPFNHYTTSLMLQGVMESPLEKKAGLFWLEYSGSFCHWNLMLFNAGKSSGLVESYPHYFLIAVSNFIKIVPTIIVMSIALASLDQRARITKISTHQMRHGAKL